MLISGCRLKALDGSCIGRLPGEKTSPGNFKCFRVIQQAITIVEKSVDKVGKDFLFRCGNGDFPFAVPVNQHDFSVGDFQHAFGSHNPDTVIAVCGSH